MFGFLDMPGKRFVEPPPRICSFSLSLVSHSLADADPKTVIIKELEMRSVTAETHPLLFNSESQIAGLDKKYFYAIADKKDVTFVGNY